MEFDKQMEQRAWAPLSFEASRRVLGFRDWGLQGLGLRVLGFRVLGFRDWALYPEAPCILPSCN